MVDEQGEQQTVVQWRTKRTTYGEAAKWKSERSRNSIREGENRRNQSIQKDREQDNKIEE